MREPCQVKLGELWKLAANKFPGYQVITVPTPDGGTETMVVTIHGKGKDEELAFKAAVGDWDLMVAKGHGLRDALDGVVEELKHPGMSRERHDMLTEALADCSSFLNCGIVTNVIPWIERNGLDREIKDLQRRVDARLGVAAQDAAEWAKARHNVQMPIAALQINPVATREAMVAGIREKNKHTFRRL